MSFTVVPLHNLKLAPGTRIPFANGLVLQDLPNWVREEKFLDYLSFHHRPIGLQRDALVLDAFPAGCLQPEKYSWTYFVSFPRLVSAPRARWRHRLTAWRNGQRLAGVVPTGQVRGEVPKETENESVVRVGSLMEDLDTIAWRKSDSSSQYEKLAFYH
jgi:hypothetical protein